MRTCHRVVGPVLLAAALLIGVPGAARAGEEAGGDIIFRLTLRGDVVDGDGFSLGINAIDNPTIISPGILCEPGSEQVSLSPCQPGSYEFVLEGRDVIPVGTQLEYTWARSPSEVIYTDTVTIMAHDQVLTVVYDYGGGSALPDTAVGASVELVPLGIAVVIASVVVGVASASRNHRDRRASSRV